MIVGSGLLATAMAPRFRDDPSTWVYAAGVSNSGCKDPKEFARERTRLESAMAEGADAGAFVYFSTCSIDDPASAASAYVDHKLRMEGLVARHPNHLVARLPQVAGTTPNPHTLLNYLYARISRSERFSAWRFASRNVIDIDDIAAAVTSAVEQPAMRRCVVNVASPTNALVPDLVRAMETVVGKVSVVDWLDTGTSYAIDISTMRPIFERLGFRFDDHYILRTIEKYYGRSAA